jgi:hypothetical protein
MQHRLLWTSGRQLLADAPALQQLLHAPVLAATAAAAAAAGTPLLPSK